MCAVDEGGRAISWPAGNPGAKGLGDARLRCAVGIGDASILLDASGGAVPLGVAHGGRALPLERRVCVGECVRFAFQWEFNENVIAKPHFNRRL